MVDYLLQNNADFLCVLGTTAETPTLTEEEKRLVESVFERYDSFDAWDLSSLSHEEFSWKQAREGLAPNENGSQKLSLRAMRVDAKREMLRRKGVVLA